jgi:hypothetical protein
MNEGTVLRVGGINVGELTTLGTFGGNNRRKIVINLEQLAPYNFYGIFLYLFSNEMKHDTSVTFYHYKTMRD